MKKLFLLVSAVALLAVSCQTKPEQEKNNIYNSVYYANGVENYYYYDDILTEKPKITFDEPRLIKEIEEIFPYEAVYTNFGEGYNNFYLMLMIDKENKASYRFLRGIELKPEMGYINSHYEGMIISKHTNSKNYTGINLFSVAIPDSERIFNTVLGKIDGKEVPSLKLYEISVSLSKDGKILQPWKINETIFDKFRPKYSQGISNKQVDQTYFLYNYHSKALTEKIRVELAREEFEKEFRKKMLKSGNFNSIPESPNFSGDYVTWSSRSIDPVMIDGWGSFYKNLNSVPGIKSMETKGIVIIKAYINKQGNVAGTQLLKGLNDKCDQAVIETMKQAKFYPQDTLISLIAPIYIESNEDKNDIDLSLEGSKTELASGQNRDYKVGDGINIHYKVHNKTEKKLENNELVVELFINGKHCVSSHQIFKEFKDNSNVFFWRAKEKGIYNYVLYIDPSNQLGDKDLANNIFKGTFEVK